MGVAKLCDFGLAIDTAVESPVGAVGTLEFMAPELLKLKALPADQLEEMRRDCRRGARYSAKARRNPF